MAKFKNSKLLKKPTASGPGPVSSRKTLSRFAQDSGPMVRQVEEKELIRDDRSQFFRDEQRKENMGVNKWLN